MTRGLWRDRRAAFGMAVLAIAVAVALFAPFLAGDPITQGDIVATRFMPPLSSDASGAFHPLGTDRFGRDVWARLAHGARISLGVGSLAVLVSVLVGVAVGAAAGFWQGWPATLLLGVTDFALALPRVVLLLLLASLWQPSAGLVILVLGLTGWMTIARLVHGEVRALAVRPFVESAVGLGASDLRVLVRHVLPNAMTPVIVAAALGLGNAIMLEAGLSFLGLGVQPPMASWGSLASEGAAAMEVYPWLLVSPGLALATTLLALNFLGDGLRDLLDPHETAHRARPPAA
jgi:peptide/nickel transport system permease protein